MKTIRRILRFMCDVWRGTGPKSLFALAKEPRPRSTAPTAKLYVLQVDFEVLPHTLESLEAQLSAIRAKYGLDFMILEPGIKLKRFDDF